MDKINGPSSEEDIRRFLLAGGSTLHSLHTSNGQPIFHRDVKPANFMKMSDDSRWPYVLVDFGTVGLGVRGTIDGGTHTGTLNYVPHKQLAFGKVNKWGENFALTRSAIHYAIGERFDEIDLDDFNIRSLDLNYSDKLLDVFASATTQDESRGYGDFRKLMHDLGYNVDGVPQTRAELEAILGGTSLPARIETETKAVAEIGEGENLSSRHIIVDNKDGTREIYWVFPDGTKERIGLEGKDVYETLKGIEKYFDSFVSLYNSGWSIEEWEQIKRQSMNARFQYAAQENPILKRVARGEQTMRELYKEVKKGKPSLTKVILGTSFEILNSFPRMLEPDIPLGTAISEYKQARDEYKQRVGELEKVVSENYNRNLSRIFNPINTGGFVGVGLGIISMGVFGGLLNVFTGYPWAPLWIAFNWGTGSFIGSNVQRGIKEGMSVRSPKWKYREMDSWLERPESPKDLEQRAGEGDVSLSEKEQGNILLRAVSFGIVGGVSTGMAAALLNPEFGGYVALLSAFSMTFGEYYALTKRKLKQKRLDAGLEEGKLENKLIEGGEEE